MEVYNSASEHEELFKILLEKSLFPAFILQDEKFVYFNKPVQDITGYNSEELENLNPFEIVHPEDRAMVYEKYILRVGGFQGEETYSFRIMTKSGEIKWITAKAFGVDYRGTRAVAVNAMDNSELIKINEELKKKNELLSLLSKILRHDILNDLTIIRSAIELRDEALFEMAESRISRIVEKIADVKLVEESMGELRIVNVSELLYYAVDKYKNETDISIESEELFVKADETLKSLFENIISNAIVHNIRKVKISIKVYKDGADCVVAIADNGIGISDRLKEKIFKERISNRKGGGLGLFIAKKIVEMFNGEIRVYNNKPVGAVFEIRIPLMDKK